MSEEINRDRRRFMRNAAMTIAAGKLAMIGSAAAQTSKISPATPNMPLPAWVNEQFKHGTILHSVH